MEPFFVFSAMTLAGIILVPFYRVATGPTVFDRLLAIGAMGSKTIALICLFGLLYGRLEMFVDIALGYSVLNFVGGITVAKYFQKRQRKTEGAL